MELVWAGHEPLEFTNLFPSWTHHIDIQTLNYKVSHTAYYLVQNNLNIQYTRTTVYYSYLSNKRVGYNKRVG